MSVLFDEPAGPSTPKLEPVSQVSFDNVVKEIHAQDAWIQILEQQRETMMQALLQANAQLLKALEQAQEADQQIQEIMGLVGQQWANSFGGGRGIATSSASPSSKVKIFMNPGIYNGSKAKFKDWWTKMKAWLDCNPKQSAYTNADGDEIIYGKNCAYAILSCLCRPKGSHFMEVELQKLTDKDIWLHNWETLIKEIEGLFWPKLQVDWAKNEISQFNQGDLDIDIFITKWQSLYHQSKINATIEVWLLENMVLPHIWFELFHINAHKATINETLIEIRKIAKAFKAYTLFSHGLVGEPTDKPNAKKWFSRRAEAEDP